MGIFFDNKLLFNEHVDICVKQSYRILGFIFRSSKHFCNPPSLIYLFNCLVRSKLEYASTVWNPYYKKNIDYIENIQKKFFKILNYKFNLNMNNYVDMLKHFNMLSLESRRTQTDMVFLFKLLNNMIYAPSIISMLQFSVNLKTRSTNLFVLYKNNTKNNDNSPINRIMSSYNSTFAHIDMFYLSLYMFKKEIINILS